MTFEHGTAWGEARALAARMGRRLPGEIVILEQSDTRVLATDVHALCDLPSFDASAMDGWAVAGDGPWEQIGTVHAGEPTHSRIGAGQACRIATGAPTPAGTTGIIRFENGTVDDRGRLHGKPSADDIRRRGEECHVAELLAPAGTSIRPPLIGLIAATGHDVIDVVRRPRVRLALMGDELLAAGLPSGGQVRDSIGPQLPAWLSRVGATVVDVRRISDARSALESALVDEGVDLVVSTGGTAAGPRDYVHGVVEGIGGRFVVDGVAVRPGHPMALADLGADRPPFVALPGNPQAAVVGLLTLAVPCIDAMLGRTDTRLGDVSLGESLGAPMDQTRLVGGVITPDGFRRSRHAGSAMLRGLAMSTGYAVIPPGGASTGESVLWLPLA